jgi:hypothetical protein
MYHIICLCVTEKSTLSVTENAMVFSDGSLKRLPRHVTEKATPAHH